MALSIGDLRAKFFGGGNDQEFAFLQAAYDSGITAAQVLTATSAQLADGGQQSNLQALVDTHDANASAHPNAIYWGTSGKSGHKIWMQTADPGVQAGHIWFVI